MNKFENFIKNLPLLEDDNIGTWIIDRENAGTPNTLFKCLLSITLKWYTTSSRMCMTLKNKTRISN